MKKFLMWLLIGIAAVLTIVAFLIPDSVTVITPKQPDKKKSPADEKVPYAEVVDTPESEGQHEV